jgi:hypothetical protein
VYTRSSLKIIILKELTEISPSGFHQLWLQVQHKNLKSILLCTTYKPPHCPVACFTNDFLEKYSISGKDVFIIGDLNCDILKNTQEARALKDLMLNLELGSAYNLSDKSHKTIVDCNRRHLSIQYQYGLRKWGYTESHKRSLRDIYCS